MMIKLHDTGPTSAAMGNPWHFIVLALLTLFNEIVGVGIGNIDDVGDSF